MDTKTELLISLLDCGMLDIDKLIEIIDTCEDFQDSALEWAIQDIEDNNMDFNVNSLMLNLLYTLKYNLIDKIDDELNIELDFVEYLANKLGYSLKDDTISVDEF